MVEDKGVMLAASGCEQQDWFVGEGVLLDQVEEVFKQAGVGASKYRGRRDE